MGHNLKVPQSHILVPQSHISQVPRSHFFGSVLAVLLVKSPGHINLYLPLGALVFEARARQKKF